MIYKDQLVCYYSDQRDPLYGQKLVHQVTNDNQTWGPVVNDVTYDNSTYRPGMTIVSKLPTDEYIMTYEFYGAVESKSLHFSQYVMTTESLSSRLRRLLQDLRQPIEILLHRRRTHHRRRRLRPFLNPLQHHHPRRHPHRQRSIQHRSLPQLRLWHKALEEGEDDGSGELHQEFEDHPVGYD